MTINSHNGQSGFISSPITRTEDNPMWSHARPRGGERVYHAALPPTPEEIQRQTDFANHSVAREAAARAGERRYISREELNAWFISQANALSTTIQSNGDTSLAKQVESLTATCTALAATNAKLMARLDAIDGNPADYGGDVS